MLPNNNVIWSEGMLLRQQHFQQQERYWSSIIAERCGSLRANQWGFMAYEVDESLLASQRFHLNQAAGIFPDGTPFSISPLQYHSLQPLEIPQETQDTLVYLALPLIQQQVNHRYLSEAVEVQDVFDEQITSAPVVIGKLNLSLRLGHDDLSTQTSIPIARIKTCDSLKGIILDQDFIPPALSCQKNIQLNKFIAELTSLLQHRAHTLAKRSLVVGSTNIADLSEFLLLQIMNRYHAMFQCIQHDSHCHPQTFHFYAAQMMAELATYTHDEKTWQLETLYQHDKLQSTFEPLMESLRQALNTVIEQPSVSIILTKTDGEQYRTNTLAPEVLRYGIFILAVRADVPGDRLQKQFPSQVKIAAPDKMQALISTHLPGLKLNPLSVVPPQLPYHNGYYYFQLEQEGELWKSIRQAQQFTVHIGKQFPGIQIYCWALKDNNDK